MHQNLGRIHNKKLHNDINTLISLIFSVKQEMLFVCGLFFLKFLFINNNVVLSKD